MKSNIVTKMLAGLFLALVSSTSFAGDLEDELSGIFKPLVITYTFEQIDKASKEKKPLTVYMNGEPKEVNVAIKKKSDWYKPGATGFSSQFLDELDVKDAAVKLDREAGTFSKIYLYKNIFNDDVHYEITFSGDAIRDFATPVTNNNASIVIHNAADGDSDVFLSFSDSFSSDEGEGSLCNNIEQRRLTTIKLLGLMLIDVDGWVEKAFTVASTSGDVYTVLNLGSRGFVNFLSAFSSGSLMEAALASADLGTAAMSVFRIGKSLYKSSPEAQELIDRANENLNLIAETSAEIEDVLFKLELAMEQVTDGLEKSFSEQKDLLDKMLAGNKDAGTLISSAVELLKKAQRQRGEEGARLEEIKKAATQIKLGWENVSGMLDDFDGEKDIKQQIQSLKEAVAGLLVPMGVVMEFIQAVVELRNGSDKLFAEAIKLVLGAAEANSEMEQRLNALLSDNQSLQELVMKFKGDCQLVEELKISNLVLEKAVVENKQINKLLQKKLDTNYNFKHVLAGAGTAFVFASCVVTTPIIAVGVGLVGLQVAKTVERVTSQENCSQFKTPIGPILSYAGMPTESIQTCGKLFGLTYGNSNF